MPKPKLNPAQELEVLRLHRDQHVKIAAIAETYNVASTTIWRILRRFNAVRRPMASKQEQKIILRMSRQRKTRAEIATFLGRSRAFVDNWQRKLYCQRKHEPTEEDKRKIIRLYREWKGQARVAKIVGVPQRAVRRTLLEAGVPIHGTGGLPILTPDKRRQAITLIRAKRHYLKDIAKKLGVNRDCIEKLAHQILGCERFFGGPLWPPLQSAFPEIERHDERLTAADYIRLLSKIFPNGLPPSPDWIVVPAVVDLLQETFHFWRTASAPVLKNLESHLVKAAATMRSAESTLVN